jgi:hypothetical protein
LNIKKQTLIRYGEVKYFRIKNLIKVRDIINKLPFIKPIPYGDEEEFRVIYQTRLRGAQLMRYHSMISV